MGFIEGEHRDQGTLFPVVLDDLIPADHVCRVIEAFVNRLDMDAMGFKRAEPAETGRPGYDPRDLLQLYLYGYLQQIRSSRRLETECKRNVELMWLLGRLEPDHKSIAEFRRIHQAAVAEAGAELVRLARAVGLVRGEWVAIDGSKFQAASSARSVHELEAVKRYLEAVDAADEQDEVVIDPSAVAAALEKLKNHPEPEARFMRTGSRSKIPAYNVQTAVDAEHAVIVVQQVTDEATDNRSLLPMAEAAHKAVGEPASLNIVADAGYSNGEQAAKCEAQGILPHVPANRSINSYGGGKLFDRTAFQYEEKTDTFLCPAQQRLRRYQERPRKKSVLYAAAVESCGSCPLKERCTTGSRRFVQRHLYDDTLNRMGRRATREVMRLRRSTVEHPFATLKYRIFGYPRFLLRGIKGAQAEISLAVMAYNLKRMIKVLGGDRLAAALAT